MITTKLLKLITGILLILTVFFYYLSLISLLIYNIYNIFTSDKIGIYVIGFNLTFIIITISSYLLYFLKKGYDDDR